MSGVSTLRARRRHLRLSFGAAMAAELEIAPEINNNRNQQHPHVIAHRASSAAYVKIIITREMNVYFDGIPARRSSTLL